MKIKILTVDGFRCLLGVEVKFEDDLTVIVGENDAGKSSLIECLKVVTQGRKVEAGSRYFCESLFVGFLP